MLDGQRGEELVEVDGGEADGGIADPERDEQGSLVVESTARVDDVGDVAVLFGRRGGYQRLGQSSDDAGGVLEVEQRGADGIGSHRTNPVGEDEPARLGLDGRTAVADLDG